MPSIGGAENGAYFAYPPTTFTLWTLGVFPDRFSIRFDLYYTSMFGNVVMFAVGFGASLLFRRRTALARDLSIWRNERG
jgi:hypothetical protein